MSGFLFCRGDILKWRLSSAPFNSLGTDGKWGGEGGKSLKDSLRKRKKAPRMLRQRGGRENWSILMRNNKWPPWPSPPAPSPSTLLTFGFGNWFTVAAVDGGILKIVTPHLINIATCTENMLPWLPAKGSFTVLFTNQCCECACGMIRASCG